MNRLLERVKEIESTLGLSEEEYDSIMERKFAKLREGRAKKTDISGGKTYEDVWDNIFDEELNYYKGKWLKLSPEERYQILNNEWSSHDSSFYHRGLYMYDGEGCNDQTFISSCRYYPKEGRIEDLEVDKWYEDYRNKLAKLKFPPRD